MPASQSTVSDLMTHTAIAIGREASYKEIVELLHEWKVSAVPVLEGEGRVVGVVSEADLLPKEEFRREEPVLPDQLDEASKAGAVLAEDLMSSPAVTVHADATAAEAARIMARKGVKRLPVVNEVGMLEASSVAATSLRVRVLPPARTAAAGRPLGDTVGHAAPAEGDGQGEVGAGEAGARPVRRRAQQP